MDQFVVDVYDSLLGELLFPVPGVENAFEDGGMCMELYQNMMDAYSRLLLRLGQKEDDPDVEIIINSLLAIQKELCLKMYWYGTKFAFQ